MKSLIAICIISMSICACLLMANISRVFLKIEKQLDANPDLIKHADETLISLQSDELKAAETIQYGKDAIEKEGEYWDREKVETLKITAGAKSLIDRTDCSLNGGPGCDGAIPKLSKTLEATASLSQAAATNLSEVNRKLTPILVDLARASKGAADAMSDPAISATLGHVDETSKQLELTSTSLAATSHDVQQVADVFRSDYLKPRNRLWLYTKTLLGLTYQARGALAK